VKALIYFQRELLTVLPLNASIFGSVILRLDRNPF
jgi:hypothetical protein